jgi:hypothetical protein
MKAKGVMPVGPSGGPANVAVQRPTVNIKEAENLGEQAVATTHARQDFTFAKHGTFGKPNRHMIQDMFE